MIRYLLLWILVFLSFNAFCQKSILWSLESEMIKDLSIHELIYYKDNCYLIGNFKDSLNIGEYSYKRKFDNGFLIKVNSAGDVLWAKAIGGENTTQIQNIFLSDNNIFITGELTLNAGDSVINRIIIYNFSLDGDAINNYSVNYKGKAKIDYIVGSGDNFMIGCMLKGTIQSGSTCITNNIGYPVVLTYSKNGELQVALSMTDMERGRATLGGLDVHANLICTVVRDDHEVFLRKYSNDAKLIWEQRFSSSEYIESTALRIDNMDNIIITLNYKGNISFYSETEAGKAQLQSLLIKIDSEGGLLSSLPILTTKYVRVLDINALSNGNHLVTGYYFGDFIVADNIFKSKTVPMTSLAFELYNFETPVWSLPQRDNANTYCKSGVNSNNDFILFEGRSLIDDKLLSIKKYFNIRYIHNCEKRNLNLSYPNTICKGDTIKVLTDPYFSTFELNGEKVDKEIHIIEPGSYLIDAYDEYRCKNSDSILIEQGHLTNIQLGNDTLIHQGDVYIVDVKDQYQTYYWEDGSNENCRIVYNHYNLDKIQLVLTAKAKGFCENSDTISISYIRDEFEISCYPNPVVDILYYNITTSDQVISIKLYNSLGVLMHSNSNENNINSHGLIDIHNYPSGSYVIYFQTRYKSYSRTIVKT